MGHQSPAESMAFSVEVISASLTGATNGTGVDMNGWDGVLFLVAVGAVTATGTLDAKVQSDSVSNFATPADISGAALTQIVDGDDGKMMAIDVWRPGERYARIVLTQATAAVVAGAYAIRYRRTGRTPPTQTLTELIKVLAN